MKYLLDSTLLIQGVRVNVSLSISDDDYRSLSNAPAKKQLLWRDLLHDLNNLTWKEE